MPPRHPPCARTCKGGGPPQPQLTGPPRAAVFCAFLEQCLVKDPKRRPAATKLLKHPFTKNAKAPKVTLTATIRDTIAALVELEAASAASQQSANGAAAEGDGTLEAEGTGTLATTPTMHLTDSAGGDGTLEAEPSGTMVICGDEGGDGGGDGDGDGMYEPAFMKHFQDLLDASEPATDDEELGTPLGLDKDVDPEDLRKRLAALPVLK